MKILATHYQYRYINRGQNLEAAIGAVLTYVQEATGRLPSVLIVPRSQEADARRVVDMVVREFERDGKPIQLEVKPIGGCLIGEIRYQLSEAHHE